MLAVFLCSRIVSGDSIKTKASVIPFCLTIALCFSASSLFVKGPTEYLIELSGRITNLKLLEPV